jgi:hypothetical protein
MAPKKSAVPPSKLTVPNDTPTHDSSQATTADEEVSKVDAETVDEDAIFATFEAEPGTQDFNPMNVSEEVKDDESAQTRRNVQMGQAIMHVGPVDPNWKVSGSLLN